MATKETKGVLSYVDGAGDKILLYPAVDTDTTLNIAGEPADAAAVGTAISETNENVSNLDSTVGTLNEKVTNMETNGSGNIIKTYDDLMANTVDSNIAGAVAVKDGFNQLNSSLSVKYNYNDDHIYVLFNNEWIKTTLNCSLKSSNWFLRGDVNNTDIFGYPMFNPRTNGISNASTYITDGYLRMDYRTDSMCEVAICSQKTIPVGIYSSITVKFLESHYLTTSDKFMFTIGFYTTNSGTHTWGGVLFPSRYSPSSLMQTITYDLTEYNNNGVEMYLEFFGITNTKIYEVTFNK